MSDPTLSDIDFKNKMTWVWTTLNIKIFDMNLPSIDKIVCDPLMLKLFHDFYIGRILESAAISYPILNRNNYHFNPLSSLQRIPDRDLI